MGTVQLVQGTVFFSTPLQSKGPDFVQVIYILFLLLTEESFFYTTLSLSCIIMEKMLVSMSTKES